MNASVATPRSLLLMLAALISLGPLAIDAYLPGMPQMADSLGVTIHSIELTLSLFLICFAAGQLIGGPFSDHYGRRLTILLGLGLYCIGSLLASLTTSIELLWVARIIQALGGGIGVVNTMAVVRDLSSGRESARIMSRIVTIMMMAPLLAPFLGSLLVWLGGWRSIFIALMAYGLLLLLVFYKALPETHPHSATSVNMNPLRRYWQVLSHRSALGYVAATAFTHAGMFAFITGSSLVYMEYYGFSVQMFPVLFGMNVMMVILSNRINIRLLNRFDPVKMLVYGQCFQLLIGASMLCSYLFLPQLPVWLLTPMIMLFIGVQGFIMGNGVSSAVEYFPQNAATATAVINACGFTMGALGGAVVGLLGDGTPLPMILVIATCPLLGILLRSWLHRTWFRACGPAA